MAAGGGGAPVSSDWMRGAREVQREVREVVRWFIRAEGGRRPRMAVAARSSAMGWRRSALRVLRAKGGEHECVERVVESLVHMAETAMARSVGRDSGGRSSAGPAMARPRSARTEREKGVKKGKEGACWCPSSSAAGRRARGRRWDARQRWRRMAATFRTRGAP
jgi:hypothetical protein